MSDSQPPSTDEKEITPAPALPAYINPRLTPGRKPGSKNKRSKAIDEIFASKDHNSVEKLIWLSERCQARLAAFDEANAKADYKLPITKEVREDERTFLAINETLLEYQYPKLRSIEVSASRFSGVQFVINAGEGKSISGGAWVEESLKENLSIAEQRAEEAKKEEGNEQ